jgi:CO dehydrogenase/acetyl-CoA synthase beta subunit
MWTDRQIIENRIFEILTYIENGSLALTLKQNIWLFSIKELQNLLEFLETWKLELIYKFLDEKYKEYLWLKEKLKIIKIWEKKKIKQIEEFNERKEENSELELLINF